MLPGVRHLCGEHTALVDSHVFPEFFYEGTYDESHRYVSVTSHPRHRPRRRQRGLTEPLLCSRCDGKIARYESYAASLLRRADAAPVESQGGITLAEVDFTLLRLFGVSLLWRAHIARSHTFAPVDLGPFAARAATMIRGEDPGKPHEFGFALAKIVGLETHGSVITGPAVSRYHGHRAFRFIARGYEWAFVVSGTSDQLGDRFPFVGQHSVLSIPFLALDKRKLFASIRRAFPRAFGDSS